KMLSQPPSSPSVADSVDRDNGHSTKTPMMSSQESSSNPSTPLPRPSPTQSTTESLFKPITPSPSPLPIGQPQDSPVKAKPVEMDSSNLPPAGKSSAPPSRRSGVLSSAPPPPPPAPSSSSLSTQADPTSDVSAENRGDTAVAVKSAPPARRGPVM